MEKITAKDFQKEWALQNSNIQRLPSQFEAELMEAYAAQKSAEDIDEFINDIENILYQHGSDHMKIADLKVLIQQYQL